jgi:outer membrane protein
VTVIIGSIASTIPANDRLFSGGFVKTRLILAAAVLSLASLPTLAQSTDLTVWAGYTGFGTTEISDPADEFSADIEFDDTLGYGISLNQFWTRNISTELGAMHWSADSTVDFDDTIELDFGSLDLTAITATAQWHFAPEGRIDPYVGAGVAYFDADDFELDDDLLEPGDDPSVPVESDATWLANAGVTFNFGRVALALDAKYSPYEPGTGENEDEGDIELDPLTLAAGVKFRF